MIAVNAETHGGVNVCENCGVAATPSRQSTRGIAPPPNELRVGHWYPQSRGGVGAPPNGQVLCLLCNAKNSDTFPWP